MFGLLLVVKKIRDGQIQRITKKFIAYLLANNLNLKAFNLCAHDAGATEEEKTKFAEILSETKDDDPNSMVYTIKLSDSALNIIRNYSF